MAQTITYNNFVPARGPGFNAPQFRNAGGVNGAENSPPQDSFNLEGEWGPAYYDARHRWVTSAIVELPWRFQLAGIHSMQSGFPFTVNLRGDTAGVGAGTGGIFLRPNAVAGIDPYLPKSEWSNGRYLNPAAFATPPTATFGDVGRNSVVGSRLRQPGPRDLPRLPDGPGAYRPARRPSTSRTVAITHW